MPVGMIIAVYRHMHRWVLLLAVIVFAWGGASACSSNLRLDAVETSLTKNVNGKPPIRYAGIRTIYECFIIIHQSGEIFDVCGDQPPEPEWSINGQLKNTQHSDGATSLPALITNWDPQLSDYNSSIGVYIHGSSEKPSYGVSVGNFAIATQPGTYVMENPSLTITRRDVGKCQYTASGTFPVSCTFTVAFYDEVPNRLVVEKTYVKPEEIVPDITDTMFDELKYGESNKYKATFEAGITTDLMFDYDYYPAKNMTVIVRQSGEEKRFLLPYAHGAASLKLLIRDTDKDGIDEIYTRVEDVVLKGTTPPAPYYQKLGMIKNGKSLTIVKDPYAVPDVKIPQDPYAK